MRILYLSPNETCLKLTLQKTAAEKNFSNMEINKISFKKVKIFVYWESDRISEVINRVFVFYYSLVVLVDFLNYVHLLLS